MASVGWACTESPSFVGGSDAAVEGAWRWPDRSLFYQGTALLYSNWEATQPDDTNARQDCMRIDPTTGAWDDIDCGLLRTFVCELP